MSIPSSIAFLTSPLTSSELPLSNVFEAAQDAADRYLQEIRMMHEQAAAELENAKQEADRIRTLARREAAKTRTEEGKRQ